MARRKIANITELSDKYKDLGAFGRMPDLTAQQFKFVEGILAGLNGAEAYRTAYDCSNESPAAVQVDASRLRSHPNVSLWISAGRMASLDAGSRNDHLAELERLKTTAEAAGNHGAAIQAEQLRGKVQGHYTERIELSRAPDPLLELKAIASWSPELAADMAKERGITWEENHAAHTAAEVKTIVSVTTDD